MNLKNELNHLFSVGTKAWTSWYLLRKEILRCYPQCMICGYDDVKRLEVHHIQPRHLFPEKALEWDNLIVLCDRNCHLSLGHRNNFKDYNPNIVEIAEFIQSKR